MTELMLRDMRPIVFCVISMLFDNDPKRYTLYEHIKDLLIFFLKIFCGNIKPWDTRASNSKLTFVIIKMFALLYFVHSVFKN